MHIVQCSQLVITIYVINATQCSSRNKQTKRNTALINGCASLSERTHVPRRSIGVLLCRVQSINNPPPESQPSEAIPQLVSHRH